MTGRDPFAFKPGARAALVDALGTVPKHNARGVRSRVLTPALSRMTGACRCAGPAD